MTEASDAAAVARRQYEAWTQALQDHAFDWLDENLAEDFQFSARPFPELRLNKTRFIEIDKKMETADISFVDVRAVQVGDIIISLAVADVRETFSGQMGEHMPPIDDINALVGGTRLAYASAWRRLGPRWVCYHHHMLGPVEG